MLGLHWAFSIYIALSVCSGTFSTAFEVTQFFIWLNPNLQLCRLDPVLVDICFCQPVPGDENNFLCFVPSLRVRGGENWN
jgi:hypothetical protein